MRANPLLRYPQSGVYFTVGYDVTRDVIATGTYIPPGVMDLSDPFIYGLFIIESCESETFNKHFIGIEPRTGSLIGNPVHKSEWIIPAIRNIIKDGNRQVKKNGGFEYKEPSLNDIAGVTLDQLIGGYLYYNHDEHGVIKVGPIVNFETQFQTVYASGLTNGLINNKTITIRVGPIMELSGKIRLQPSVGVSRAQVECKNKG